MDTSPYSNFESLDIRVGTILQAKLFSKARKPAYQLVVDFGEEIGHLQSSAQLTELYAIDDLIGKQILAVVF